MDKMAINMDFLAEIEAAIELARMFGSRTWIYFQTVPDGGILGLSIIQERSYLAYLHSVVGPRPVCSR